MQNIFNRKVTSLVLLIIVAGAALYFFKPASQTLPEKFSLAVPFSTQAPTNNWDDNKDCEETSLIMANAFLSGNTAERLAVDEAVAAINSLKSWEDQNLGYNKDTGADATAKLAQGALNLKVRQIKDYTREDLKRALNDGHPILLPINARLLNNPKYLDAGPFYHMFVVRGYDGDNFFVNDPGTETGINYSYSFDTLVAAAVDWDHGAQSMDSNNKQALILSK